MHILGTTCFCYVQNKTKLDPHSEKGIFISYDKQSPAYLIYFPETMAIKRVRGVKFTNSYDNIYQNQIKILNIQNTLSHITEKQP